MRPILCVCPTCHEPFQVVSMDPPDRSVGIMGATIVEISGWVTKEGFEMPVCAHVQTWFDSTAYETSENFRELNKFADRIYDQLDREARDRYEDEMEARYERWRDG